MLLVATSWAVISGHAQIITIGYINSTSKILSFPQVQGYLRLTSVPYLIRPSFKKMVEFSAPVGGTALPEDFAPSILFAILYACLAPLMLYRMFDRRSRCILLIKTITFSVEKVFIFSLRAVLARNDQHRFSKGFVPYMQISFGLGFIGIASDVVKLTRCLLVNATYGPELYHESPAAASKGVIVPPPTADTPDQPRVRSWCRGVNSFLGLAFFAALVPGILGNSSSNQSKVFDSQKIVDMTATYRVVSSAVVVALSCILICAGLWGYCKLPRVSKRGVAITAMICSLMIMVGIYRLSVMQIKTTSLSAPSVLDTPRAKAAFYVFHVLPEWLASLILFGVNIRKTLGTGMWGDWRIKDETEKQRAKREKREAKRKNKKMQLIDTEKAEMKGQT
ncbi:hypothetical protein BYT27DRAFT_6399129 [Phlegmacium glaucopus]|nr:hypothetical protein BYT27DRAFT_6399129 [Phlegmacium glaucopus]